MFFILCHRNCLHVISILLRFLYFYVFRNSSTSSEDTENCIWMIFSLSSCNFFLFLYDKHSQPNSMYLSLFFLANSLRCITRNVTRRDGRKKWKVLLLKNIFHICCKHICIDYLGYRRM